MQGGEERKSIGQFEKWKLDAYTTHPYIIGYVYVCILTYYHLENSTLYRCQSTITELCRYCACIYIAVSTCRVAAFNTNQKHIVETTILALCPQQGGYFLNFHTLTSHSRFHKRPGYHLLVFYTQPQASCVPLLTWLDSHAW